jgi:hypothetical protein
VFLFQNLLMKQIDLHDPSSSYYNVKKCPWNTMYLNIFMMFEKFEIKKVYWLSLICSTFRSKSGNLKELCEISNISWNTKCGLSSYRKTHIEWCIAILRFFFTIIIKSLKRSFGDFLFLHRFLLLLLLFLFGFKVAAIANQNGRHIVQHVLLPVNIHFHWNLFIFEFLTIF